MSRVLTLVNSRYDSMTNSEKKVAKTILSTDTKEILKMTVNEMANLCNVSEATIIRFVKKLGFDSFQEFKLSIAMEMPNNLQNQDMDITIEKWEDPNSILKKVLVGFIRTIESTANIQNMNNFISAVNMIRSANKIEIYGVGASGAVAKVFQYKLLRTGFPATAIEDPHMQCISAANLKPGDLAIGISQSGSTKDTVDSLATAKKRKASTIAITDHVNSPITKYADIVIETYSRENPVKMSAGRSIVAQIFVVEVIIGILHSMEYERSTKVGERTAKAVANKLY
ncbi:MAG: MurR/RpiR family transcriptional regulator [Thermotogaceae bacterium]|nr:MurR/RpiR family transcriptional regulator [Thermotogaceae bacterium]